MKSIYWTICLLTSFSLYGQGKPKYLFAGYKINLGYNLYQWQEKGTGTEKRSVGQVLNLLPNLGGGFWIGNYDWNLSLEGDVEYAPFSLDVQEYSGMGAVALPVLLKGGYMIKGINGVAGIIRLGVGVQWQSSEWYFRPKSVGKTPTVFDRSYIGELSLGLVVGDFRRSHVWSMEFFARVGGNPQQQWGVYTGLQLSYWDRFGKYNPSKGKI